MIKINRKLILILALILVVGVLSGCKKKAPDGLTQEFYDDIVYTTKDLFKNVKNITKNDIDGGDAVSTESYSEFCEKYYNNDNLTITEQKTFSSLSRFVIHLTLYAESYFKDTNTEPDADLINEIDKLSDFLDIEFKSSDIIFK